MLEKIDSHFRLFEISDHVICSSEANFATHVLREIVHIRHAGEFHVVPRLRRTNRAVVFCEIDKCRRAAAADVLGRAI